MTTETQPAVDFGALDGALDIAMGYPPDDEVWPPGYRILRERLERDEDRTLAFISRRLQALIARKEPLDRQRDAMLEHYRAEAEPLVRQMQYLSDLVSQVLLARRERSGVKSLTLLGIGDWKSRAVSGGWDIDERVALEKLTDDERALYVEDKPSLKKSELRAYLDSLIEPALASLAENLTPEERSERLAVITEALREQYGVTYRPERVSVKGPLE